MRCILDAAVHMRATNPARVPPDRRRRVNHLKLVAVLKHSDVFAWHNGDDSKGRTVGFPAFAAAAGVVVGDIAFDADLTGLSWHLQTKVPPAKLPEPCFTPLSTDGWI